jgi:membrane-associated protease RseP (regulator of RpoE activity)
MKRLAMQALSLRRWSAGLVRRPWIVTLCTVAACAAFAARATGALLEARALPGSPEALPRPGLGPPAPPPATARHRGDGGQLVARNMFCSSCLPGQPGSAGTPGPPTGALADASLIATALGREPYATLVIAGTAVAGAWGVGDAVPGLGRVDRIAPTWIEIVDGTGRRGRLSLLDAAAGRGPDTAMPGTAPAAPAAWSDRLRKLDDTTYEVDRSLVRELVSGAGQGGIRMFPVLEHGAVAGVRLASAPAGSIAAAAGLARGDLLTAINGDPIRSLQQMLDLYAGLDQLTSVELSGTRAGKPLVRTLRLR